MAGAEMPGAVELSFTYTEDEYISAARLYFARAYDTKFRFYLSVGFLVCASLIAWLAGNVYVAAMMLLPGLLVLARYWYSYSVLPRSYFRSNPKFREPYELTFSDKGILFRSKGVESRVEWDFYTKVLETPDYFFLVYGKDMFSLLPKRALREHGQESALRELLRRKFGAKLKRFGLPEEPTARDIEREYVPPTEPPDWR
jgi:hypothetical protein